MNDNFVKNLNSFQDTAICELIKHKFNKIFIKSNKFTGKTMLAGKLFKNVIDDVVIYHTGCCPELFNRAKEQFINILNDNISKNITIILDEFYDEEILSSIDKKNITCYVFTNDISLSKNNYLSFNYYEYYSKFINNEFGNYLNIHQVLNKNKNYDVENEKLRQSSKNTITYIKKNNEIKEYKLEC